MARPKSGIKYDRSHPGHARPGETPPTPDAELNKEEEPGEKKDDSSTTEKPK